MSKPRREESRHRWTTPERKRLIEESKPHRTLKEAARAIYLAGSFSPLKEQAIYGQLYALHLRGQTPWLEMTKERAEHPMGISTPLLSAIREVVRCMRVERQTDILISVTDAGAKVQMVSRQSKTLDIEM